MLTPVIKFDVHNFKLSHSKSYVVPNTPDMVDLVLRNRFTRNIHFTQDFSLDAPEYLFPVSFINYSAEDDIDPIDQMH